MKDDPITVVKRYSLAFVELVEEKKLGKEIEALEGFIKRLDSYPKLKDLVFNKYINRGIKAELIKKLSEELKLSSNLHSILRIMIKYNRFHFISEFSESIKGFYDMKQGIINVEVTLANDNLKKNLQDKIEHALQAKFKKKVRLAINRDKNLIAGLKLQTEGLLYDATVKKTLSRLKGAILD